MGFGVVSFVGFFFFFGCVGGCGFVLVMAGRCCCGNGC